MKKKILCVFISVLAMAVFSLPMYNVIATEPEPLTGTILMLPVMEPPMFTIQPSGKSSISINAWNDLPMVVSGDIMGTGFYNGQWTVCRDPFEIRAANGWYTLDVTIGTLSGQLKLHVSGQKITIISGTEDLISLHGKGRITPVNMVSYTFVLNAHFDP